MKPFVLLFIYSFLSIGCNNDNELKLKNREDALKQKEIEIQQKEIEIQQKEDNLTDSKGITSNKKVDNASPIKEKNNYVYVIITVNKPIITSETKDINKKLREGLSSINKENSSTAGLLPQADLPIPDPVYITTHNIIPHYYEYTSEIIETKNLTEDDKYRIMDNFQKSLEESLKLEDKYYSLKVNYDRTSTIEQRECKVFDSYKEASMNKNKKVE